MPEQSYPPASNDSGALTIPRQLNRWLDKQFQNGPVRRTQGYFELPAYNVTGGTYYGYSDIIVAFNYNAAKRFKITGYDKAIYSAGVLCVAWVQNNGDNVITHRYRLTSGGAFYQEIPVYNRQLIETDFRIEVWSDGIEGFPSLVTSDTSFKIYTTNRGNFDYRFQTDFTTATPVEVTDFSASEDVTGSNVVIGFAGEGRGQYNKIEDYNGHPQFKYITDDSNIYYLIRYNTVSEIIELIRYHVDTEEEFQIYYIAGTTIELWLSNPIDTWDLGADGTAPVPDPVDITVTSGFTLPLTFPSDSAIP